jgi:Glycosyl transferases group 1
MTFNNCNGDVNMRVFEALAVGACLLTDTLSDATGMNAIFRDGEHLITYGSAAELMEKIAYYIDRPEECLAIAQRGNAAYRQHFSETLRKQAFMEFAFSDDAAAAQLAQASQQVDPRNQAVSATATQYLHERVLVYEQMQELQSQRLVNHVCLSAQTDDAFASDLSDLVYTRIDRLFGNGAETCVVLQANELAAHVSQHATDLPDFIFLRPGSEADEASRKLLAENGYHIFTEGLTTHPGCYQRRKPLAPNVTAL